MTTTNREHEALTTVEAVQKALKDGRAVECMWFGSDGWRPVTPKDDYDVAYFTCHGVQYRAPAASVASDETTRLRELAMTCYTGLVAECGLPDEWADTFWAASQGEPFSVDGLLPYAAPTSPHDVDAKQEMPDSDRLNCGKHVSHSEIAKNHAHTSADAVAWDDDAIDAELNRLYRSMIARGEHNGGMVGVAWNHAVFRRALSYTAPPAAPVVSEAAFLRHCLSVMRGVVDLCMPRPSRSDDDPTEYHGGQAIDELERCADELKTRLAALSVPATDDKAPAVDAVAAGWRLRRHPNGSIEAAKEHHGFVVGREGNPFDARIWDFLNDMLNAAPTSPHDVDAGWQFRSRLTSGGEWSPWHELRESSPVAGRPKYSGGMEYEYRPICTCSHDVDAVRVDAAMVERACMAMWPSWKNPILQTADNRLLMTRILTAALRKPGGA